MKIFGKFSKSIEFYLFVLIVGTIAIIALACFIRGEIATGLLQVFTICMWFWAGRNYKKSLKRMKDSADDFFNTSDKHLDMIKLEHRKNMALLRLIRDDGSIDMMNKAGELMEWRPEVLEPKKDDDDNK